MTATLTSTKARAATEPVELAKGFVEELADRAPEIEELRAIPEDLSRSLASAGFYQLCTPKELGGSGRSPIDYANVVETLAQGDGSVGWCIFIGITSSLSICSLEPSEARNLLSEPGVRTAGVFAPKGKAIKANVDGVSGYRVSGQWQWGSGTRNADWVTGGALAFDNQDMGSSGNPTMVTVVFHKDEIEILDTWHVTGLKGTGSNDYKVNDVFVPDSRVALTKDRISGEHPIYEFPLFGFLGIGIGAVALGLARSSIDEVIELASVKTPQGSSKTLAMRSSTHKDIAKAEALLRSSRAFFYQVIGEAWDVASGDGGISMEHRRNIRLATTHAVKSCAEAIHLMYTLAGGSSVYATSPIQRHFRDVHVATQHMMVADPIYEVVGRFFLGLEDNAAQL